MTDTPFTNRKAKNRKNKDYNPFNIQSRNNFSLNLTEKEKPCFYRALQDELC